MQTSETEFWLYLSHKSEQAVKNFVRKKEQQHNNLNIEINKVDKASAFFNPEDNVVVSELGGIPHWQLILFTLESVAYEAYCLCKKQRTPSA